MKYPYFLKPEGLNEVLNGIYLETLITLPKTPKQPYLEKGIGGVAETIIYIASSVTILCIFGMIISKDNENMADGFKILGGALGVIILGIVIGNSVRDSRKQDFDRKQYLYYKEKTSYDRKLKIAEEIKSNINYLDKNEKTNYLLTHFYNANSTIPESSHINYKEGKSEQMFYKYLINYFDENISKGKTILKDYIYENNYRMSYEIKNIYLPDFVYHNPKSGICIDIEIDERIEKTSGKTIHKYTDENERKRDTFFTKNGWFVLRFAEEQILNDTIGCIAYLVDILNQFDSQFEIKEKYKEILKLNKENELKIIDRW